MNVHRLQILSLPFYGHAQAPDLTGLFYSALIGRSIISLKDVLQAVLEVPPIEEEGDAPLVDGGHGTAFIYGILSRYATPHTMLEVQLEGLHIPGHSLDLMT
jgi:hypothetical protein